MIRRQFIMKRVLAVLLAAIGANGCSQDSPIRQVDEGSIQIENRTSQFGMTVDHHLRNPLSPVVYISWFPAPNTEELAEMNSTGAGLKGWVRAGGSAGPMLFTHINPAKLEEIRSLLRQMPPSGQHIQQHAAVIVTFDSGSGLETRVYDRFSLPSSVHRMWHILSAPGMVMDCGPTTQS